MIKSAKEAREIIERMARRTTIPLEYDPIEEEFSEKFRAAKVYLAALEGPEVQGLIRHIENFSSHPHLASQVLEKFQQFREVK